MFEREHHIRIAMILQALDSRVLDANKCLFGGGTAIVLSHDEYRESTDIDFLVSDLAGYRALRLLLTGGTGVQAIARAGMKLTQVQDIRADQYGIRALLRVADTEVKFEIVYESRIQFDEPVERDRICGVSVLTALDLAASKLLANSDCWSDDGVFSRDLIDLAMLRLPRPELGRAIEKATGAYGQSVERDLVKAIDALASRKGRLETCMTALKIGDIPKALLWKWIRDLKKAV